MTRISANSKRSRLAALALSLLMCILAFEFGARYIVDPRLGMPTAFNQFVHTEEHTKYVAGVGRRWVLDPELGWSDVPFVTERITSSAGQRMWLLILGDSVTAGEDVKRGEEDYVAKFADSLDRQGLGAVRITNLAVSGYGLDQMILRLQRQMEQGVDVVVVAFIPHDLRRVAMSLAFGWSKPIFVVTTRGIELRPPRSTRQFYETYRNARDSGSLALWYLYYFWNERRYFAPWFYGDEYSAIFEELRTRAETASLGKPLVFLKLPDTSKDWARGLLVERGKSVFGRLYREIDACAFDRARQENLAPEKIFHFHPTVEGHAIIAHCLSELFPKIPEISATNLLRP